VTWLMGDRGIPRTWRHMNGYGSRTLEVGRMTLDRNPADYHAEIKQAAGCSSSTQPTGIPGRAATQKPAQRLVLSIIPV
jgi:catalase